MAADCSDGDDADVDVVDVVDVEEVVGAFGIDAGTGNITVELVEMVGDGADL